jgi:transposase
MMTKKRQQRSADFKFWVALAALKEQQTLSQLTSEYEVHPTQIT